MGESTKVAAIGDIKVGPRHRKDLGDVAALAVSIGRVGLLAEWGFRYVTCLTWCKPSVGMGNYFRGSTDHLRLGVRGGAQSLWSDARLHRRDAGMDLGRDGRPMGAS